jgi:hypothetical protein
MPQSKWEELAKFTPEEMKGKTLLPSAAKDYKQQVRLEPDHTPINHDIPEDPIPVQGGMMNLNCPCSKKVTAWTELPAIRHQDVLLDLPFKQGEQPYLLVLPLDQGASIPPERFMA